MRKLVKIFIIACFLGVIAYLGVPGFVEGHGVPAIRIGNLLPQDVAVENPCPDARENPLPLPSTYWPDRLDEYEELLFELLDNRTYAGLNWCVDKGVRDTGPWIQGQYYGTHPAVRIYYSPRVMTWLTNGRQGEIPDGAMIVKEMFDPPAARYDGLSDEQLAQIMNRSGSWTIMIKDSAGSKDGWFWGTRWMGQTVDSNEYP